MSFRNLVTDFIITYKNNFNKKYSFENEKQTKKYEKLKIQIEKDILKGEYDKIYKVRGWFQFKQLGIYFRDNYKINLVPVMKNGDEFDKTRKFWVCLM